MAEIVVITEPDGDQLAALAKTLAHGFAPDPVWSWMFCHPKHRGAEMRAYFEAYLPYALATGAVVQAIPGDEPDTFDAVFAYFPAGTPLDEDSRHNDTRLTSIRKGCPTSYEHITKAEETLARYRPAEPHLYSTVLAVRPDRKGDGYGRQLWTAFAAAADREGVGAYGEATTPSNFRWETTILGAHMLDAPVHIADNPAYPVFYPMWRPPRQGGHPGVEAMR